MSSRINIEKYNIEWPKTFELIKKTIWPEISDVAISIEHVGSTSVPDLAAKPVIDVDIVVETVRASNEVITRLQKFGYVHLGDMGVSGRQAFKRPADSFKHNLYVCLNSSTAFKNHILLRNHLRTNPQVREQYGNLKMRLAEEFAGNIDGYCEAKTPFILQILGSQGLSSTELLEISDANKIPTACKKQITIGVAQTANSLDVVKNFNSIKHFLNKFKNEGVDLIVFPECSLSGFSAKMKECTSEFLEKYILDIQEWSNKNNIQIILPTVIVEDGKVYNSGFLFKQNKRQQFFKIGLTDSEKQFFSVPENTTTKVLTTQGFNYGLLICKEAQQDPWTYIDENVDFIIWPGYWGWAKDFAWQEQDENKDNLVFLNSVKWKRPIIQSNFAYNDLGQHTGAGPEGLSIVVDSDNKVVFQASHLKESGYIVNLEKINNGASVISCRHLDESVRSL